MTPKTVYIATIEVAILADSENDALDVLSESLAQVGDQIEHGIMDWAYVRRGNEHVMPVRLSRKVDPETYKEGDLFKIPH